MSDTITGILEEIAIVKTGKGKRGAWTLRKITVDGEKYSTFDPVKATYGSTVTFESEENEQGYKDVVKGSFQVIEEATPAAKTKTEQKTAERTQNTNVSIENQVALKCAVEFCGGLWTEGQSADDVLKLAVKAYGQFASLLHPQAGSSAKPATAKPKDTSKVEPEDEKQDETPDY